MLLTIVYIFLLLCLLFEIAAITYMVLHYQTKKEDTYWVVPE